MLAEMPDTAKPPDPSTTRLIGWLGLATSLTSTIHPLAASHELVDFAQKIRPVDDDKLVEPLLYQNENVS